MALSDNISTLAIRIATEFKTLRTQLTGNNQGDLSGLQTADQSSLVAAINELVQTGGGAGDLIDDDAPSASTTYSSNKIESLVGDVADDVSGLSSTVSTLSGQVSTLSGDVSGLESAVAAKPDIDDEAPSATTVYSSSETEAKIQAAIDALIGNAPQALDTLQEIADALADDDDAISALTTQVGNKVSFVEQSLTSEQQTQARTNIGAAAASALTSLQGTVSTLSSNVGNTDEDFDQIFADALEDQA